MIPTLIAERRAYSGARVEELQGHVKSIEVLRSVPGLCIYVTGSFGRLEASRYSDLDLFFLSAGSSKTNSVSRINKALLDAGLIKICRDMGFPEFSNDGQYLEIHYLEDMKEKLGGSQDDYLNLFTARMLLLLESRPVINQAIYKETIEAVIDAYYRDYHDHEKDFRPIFLVNDLVRFWKTLCLNYEHNRERSGEDEAKRLKAHLRNLKLKFSRLLTCFSAIVLLSKNRSIVTPEKLAQLVEEPPLKRLEISSSESVEAGKIAQLVFDDYSWFLEVTGQKESAVLDWIADRENRNAAFERAKGFGKSMYELLLEVTKGSEIVRYLVI